MVSEAPLAITMGEPAGIGGEILVEAYRRRDLLGLSPFFLIGDPQLWSLKATGVPLSTITSPEDALSRFETALPILPLALDTPARPGRLEPTNARAVIASIDRAVAYARSGDVAGIVTLPIQKSTMKEAGFTFPGHTEYLGALAGEDGMPASCVMMLAVEGLRVVPVTVHIPMAEVSDCLTRDAILEKARITAAALQRDFGIAAPRLAIAALNPHAGEDGTIGDEESRIIKPAVDALRREGIAAAGPFPADTLFHEEARTSYDAALCMYHDQALIPLKTLDFFGGVNITLGLPFVRTSPDHGTALDLAGTGKARADSLIAAIRTAGEIAGRRTRS